VDFYHFPIAVSLGVIIVTLVASILASLYLPPKYAAESESQHQKTGSVFGHSHEEHPPQTSQEHEEHPPQTSQETGRGASNPRP
jgi:hypothetical protein